MNTKKEKSKAAFDQQAATYDHDFKGSHARTLYPVMLKKLSQIPFQSALDLGCGTGEMMKLILQADPHKELYGIENFTDMIGDETIAEDPETLVAFLTEKNHPALGMDPMM